MSKNKTSHRSLLLSFAPLLLLAACGGGSSGATANTPAPSATIGPGGGTLATGDGAVLLEVPAGALTAPTPLSVTRRDADTLGWHGLGSGAIYEFSPDGTRFMQPARLTLRYDALPPGDEAGLNLMKLREDGLLQAADDVRVDTANRTASASIHGFSQYAHAVDAPPPDYRRFHADLRIETADQHSIRLSGYTPSPAVLRTGSRFVALRIERAPAFVFDGADARHEPHDADYITVADVPYAYVRTNPRWQYSDTGLPSGTAYRYRMRMRVHTTHTHGGTTHGHVGVTLPSAAVVGFTTPDGLNQPPPAAEHFAAIAIGPRRVRLNWTPVPSAEGYRLDRRPAAAVEFQQIGSVPAVAEYIDADIGLAPDTEYVYRLTPFNNRGDGADAEAAARTLIASDGAADFTLCLDRRDATRCLYPAEQRLARGQGSVQFPVDIVRVGGFSGDIRFALFHLAAGMRAQVVPALAGAARNAASLSIGAGAAARGGTHYMTLHASGGGTHVSVPIAVTVHAAGGIEVVVDDPLPIELLRGGAASVRLRGMRTGGYSGPIHYSASGAPVDLSIDGFDANPTNPPSDATELRLSAPPTLAVGDYTLTVHAFGDGLTHETVLPVRVSVGTRPGAPVPRFTVTPEYGAPIRTNEPVIFDAGGSTDDGTIVGYLWDFDGDSVFDSAQGPITTHLYPAPGFYIARLRVRDNDGNTSDAGLSVDVQGGGIQLSVGFSGNGQGSVTSSPAGISCSTDGGTCANLFPFGGTVMLTANPYDFSGSSFGAWNGCDSVSGATCTVIMNTTRTADVRFDR